MAHNIRSFAFMLICVYHSLTTTGTYACSVCNAVNYKRLCQPSADLVCGRPFGATLL